MSYLDKRKLLLSFETVQVSLWIPPKLDRKPNGVANAMVPNSLGSHEQTVGSARQLRQEVRTPPSLSFAARLPISYDELLTLRLQQGKVPIRPHARRRYVWRRSRGRGAYWQGRRQDHPQEECEGK